MNNHNLYKLFLAAEYVEKRQEVSEFEEALELLLTLNEKNADPDIIKQRYSASRYGNTGCEVFKWDGGTKLERCYF